MQGTRAHMSACCTQPSNRAMSAQPVLASVARAEARAALLAAGGIPRARRGRRGGRSQQVQLVRIDRVDNFVQNFYGATSRSCSRSRGRRPLPSAPLVRGARPKAGPLNVFAPRAAPVVPRGVQTPLIPPSSPLPLLAQDLPRPPPPPPAAAPRRMIPWPERVLQVFRMAGISQDNYEPLEWNFDNWARAHRRHRSQARPLPGEVFGGPPSLFIGFHGTDDSGLLAILQTSGGEPKPWPASWGGNYVCVKGFLAYASGSEDGRQANSDEAQRILNRIREKSSKHACGVIIEVSMWGVHKTCRSVADEWGWGGTPHCFTRAKDHTGSRWAMPSEDAVVRPCVVDES